MLSTRTFVARASSLVMGLDPLSNLRSNLRLPKSTPGEAMPVESKFEDTIEPIGVSVGVRGENDLPEMDKKKEV